MKIFKYQVPFPGIDQRMQIGSKVLSLQMQNDIPTIWVLVDDSLLEDEHFHMRRFRYVGTGYIIDIDSFSDHYIGTIQQGEFVWHLFESYFI